MREYKADGESMEETVEYTSGWNKGSTDGLLISKTILQWRTDTPKGPTDQALIYAKLGENCMPFYYLGRYTKTGWTVPGLWFGDYVGELEVLAWAAVVGPVLQQ